MTGGMIHVIYLLFPSEWINSITKRALSCLQAINTIPSSHTTKPQHGNQFILYAHFSNPKRVSVHKNTPIPTSVSVACKPQQRKMKSSGIGMEPQLLVKGEGKIQNTQTWNPEFRQLKKSGGSFSFTFWKPCRTRRSPLKSQSRRLPNPLSRRTSLLSRPMSLFPTSPPRSRLLRPSGITPTRSRALPSDRRW